VGCRFARWQARPAANELVPRAKPGSSIERWEFHESAWHRTRLADHQRTSPRRSPSFSRTTETSFIQDELSASKRDRPRPPPCSASRNAARDRTKSPRRLLTAASERPALVGLHPPFNAAVASIKAVYGYRQDGVGRDRSTPGAGRPFAFAGASVTPRAAGVTGARMRVPSGRRAAGARDRQTLDAREHRRHRPHATAKGQPPPRPVKAWRGEGGGTSVLRRGDNCTRSDAAHRARGVGRLRRRHSRGPATCNEDGLARSDQRALRTPRAPRARLNAAPPSAPVHRLTFARGRHLAASEAAAPVERYVKARYQIARAPSQTDNGRPPPAVGGRRRPQ